MHPRKPLALGPLIVAVAALAGCGVSRELKPQAGHSLPVAPYGANERPGSADLLATTSQERPGRNVELRARSEVRVDDPFDLPPHD